MASHYLVNCLPGIEKKRYLELGVFKGGNFHAVKAKEKVSVDIEFQPTFLGTTDQFFAQLSSSDKFDIVYIDACHERDFVVRDFNNTLRHLTPGGIVLVHDLIPDTERFTAPHFCGDGYVVLAHILTNQSEDYHMYSLNSDYGLTVFINPRVPISLPPGRGFVSYADFRKVLARYKLYSRPEVQEVFRKIA